MHNPVSTDVFAASQFVVAIVALGIFPAESTRVSEATTVPIRYVFIHDAVRVRTVIVNIGPHQCMPHLVNDRSPPYIVAEVSPILQIDKCNFAGDIKADRIEFHSKIRARIVRRIGQRIIIVQVHWTAFWCSSYRVDRNV